MKERFRGYLRENRVLLWSTAGVGVFGLVSLLLCQFDLDIFVLAVSNSVSFCIVHVMAFLIGGGFRLFRRRLKPWLPWGLSLLCSLAFWGYFIVEDLFRRGGLLDGLVAVVVAIGALPGLGLSLAFFLLSLYLLKRKPENTAAREP